MNANQDRPESNEHIQGYRILRKIKLADIEAVFIELEHAATGARHIHIQNQDPENTFGVVLKTVPKDSTGVAHILEHTVLCGSQKFPVRDPFFSMLKRSLSTFMNALTASDWTMYPFATQNRKDYYNLMNVYLDSVFNPRIDELSFKQEGHRLDIETDPENDPAFHLVYKGVVYNEMKGAMSSPDQVMARSLLQALYPDTTYRFNSGGEPAVIPRLTYDQLKAFHRHHYHPSNSYFYTYGNLPLEDNLAFINENYLNRYTRIRPDTDVLPQPRWEAPRQATFFYPLAETEDSTPKSQVALAWLMADVCDTFQVLTLALLEQILLGNPGSPLRKALIDSQLGTTLCDSAGFEGDNRDTMFVCGLKGVEASAAEKIESLVLDVLSKLVQDGIDDRLIESAIHQLEFHRKEITNSPYPYGIKQLLIMVGNWIHGGDPLKRLQFNEELKRIRRAMEQERFFEKAIETHFLDNPHRVLFKLLPDQEMATKERQRVKEELTQTRNQLDTAALEKIRMASSQLARLQEASEDVSCLPTLTREDIPAEVYQISATSQSEAMPLTVYAQNTSGIFYFTAAIGVGSLEADHLPLVPFLCFALPKIGTLKRDYAEMVQRIDRYTGGVNLLPQARMYHDPSGVCIPFLSFNAKCLNRNCDRMFEIIQELMVQADFSDVVRLKNLLMEYRANLESMVVSNGHRLAISLAARNFSITRNLSEAWSGITQLSSLKEITDALDDQRLHALSEQLSGIRDALFVKQHIKMALIGEADSLATAEVEAETLFDHLGDSKAHTVVPATQAFGMPPIDLPGEHPREGWHTSSAVSFVAKAFNTVRMEHADAPALAAIAKMLRSLYLHREIREKGGAYGGFALYNSEDGLFCYASYRDPHIINTLNVYRGAVEFIQSGPLADQDVDEAVLQVCSEIDKPDPPGPAARKGFYRDIVGLSDAARLKFKQRLLNLTRQKVREVAAKYFHPSQSEHGVAVISGENQLLTANQSLDPPLVLHRI